ncbi:uncharacterized protein LOC110181584 [Drosophila serrata]|uniref:uncharacterized protein LOC110181584 n=1 Tax=Drosophila serrata TaxID=7274 RepID=UPI000A1D1C05|nr:uncharacterized protein LOC110181584 [Drosophila serrata]
MTEKSKTKRTASDSDSDSEDDAQVRQFLEAADTTLLTNAMFQSDTKEGDGKESIKEAAQAPPAKSERYLEEQDAPASDLQITKEMQTHIWSRLSGIIQSQIEFCHNNEKPKHQEKTNEHEESGVRLVSNADCYLIADLVVEGPAGPSKKPIIKRRVIDEDNEPSRPETTTALLQAVAVSGESVLEGKDVLAWAEKKQRPDKLFQYRSSGDAKGGKLLAIEPTNEFTKRRRQNNWNESKIARRKKNKA